MEKEGDENGETPGKQEELVEEPIKETPDPDKKTKKKSQKTKEQKAKQKEKLKQKEAKKKEKSMKQILREKQKLEERKNKFTEEDQLSRLEKYDLEDSKDPDNNEFIADESFKGPAPYRKPKDQIWILIFIILNMGLGVTAYLSISNGDLNRLINGYDFRSVLCGVGSYADKPYLYFINPVQDINVGMCVQHCPSTTGNKICLYEKDGVTPTGFCYVQMQTTYNGRYCYPVEPINHGIVDNFLNSFYNIVRRTITDFMIAKEVIAYGIILAIVISLLFLTLLKHQKTVALVSWGSIFFTFIVIAGLGYLFYSEYQNQKTISCPFSDNSNCAGWKPNLFYAMFILICIAGGLYFFSILRYLGRINLAIGILKAASKTTSVLSQLRIIPIVMTILGLAFGSLTIFCVLKSFGCGEVLIISAKNIDGGEVKIIYWSAYIQWLIIYNIIMLCYWLLAILTYSDLVTSYALAIWFFVKNKETVNIPVKRSFRDITKYHLGSLFFGSWANTVFGIPKMIMALVTRALRKAKQHSNSIRCLSATCMVCIHVYQKLLRYISKNSVVQTSLWGDNYYHSSKKAYFLLFRNANLTKDLDYLQSFMITQTKLCVSFISAACVYAYLKFFTTSYIFKENLKDLESPFAPTIIVFFIAFFLASLIQGSFDITSKTIIQCYLIDCEMFVGEQRYAEDFIRVFMDFFSKSSEKKIFVESSKKKDDSKKRKDDLSESADSSENKEDEKIEEEEEEEEEDEEEDDEDEDSEEESEESEEESEELDEDEKKERENDLENPVGPQSNGKFIEDAPDANVEFYNNPMNGKVDEEDEEDDSDDEEAQQNQNNPNSIPNPMNDSNKGQFNNQINIMNNSSTNPQNVNKNLNVNVNNPMASSYNGNNAGNMINPIMPQNVFDEGTPLKHEEPEEWKVINLNNQSYDNIKSQVFNLMESKKEEKSFNFFDKAQVNDTTWKFDDPFDMPPAKNYRPY